MRCLIGIIFLFSFTICTAQTKFTLSGYVFDFESGEALSGASVSVVEMPLTGVVCNSHGFYSLSLPEGDYHIKVKYIGYEIHEFQVKISRNFFQTLKLKSRPNILNEFEVSAAKAKYNMHNENEGFDHVQVKDIQNVPVLLGEKDVMKTLTLNAGVKSIGEGDGNIFVRGGNNSHNLVLLDGATVFNANHLLGFFSAFNSDAISDLSFYKGTAPVTYGGRLASVMDIKMNEGNNKKYHVGGGIGLISSRLTLEGPVVKERGSFLISGRRTYADALMNVLSNKNIGNNEFYFYDLNIKMNYQIDEKNRIFLSGYVGRDNLFIPDHIAVDWGNKTATLRWLHVANGKLLSNTSLVFSDFDYKVDIIVAPSIYSITSGINNLNMKQEFQYFHNENNTFTFGYNGICHFILPGQLDANANSFVNPMQIQHRYGLENAFFLNNNYRPGSEWNINYGLRISSFHLMGPGDFYSYQNGQVVDTASYASGKVVKTYLLAEPRLNVSYNFIQGQSLKLSYSRNSQFLHLVSNSTGSLPTDIWIISGKNVLPEISDQVSAGYYRNLKEDTYLFSAEIYYKWMQHQIDLKNGADIRANEHIEGELLSGDGRAYGLELMMKKEHGRLNGWIAYTLSRTELNIPGINNGKWYPARQDATHDLSIVGIYNLSDAWSLSGTWIYQTGNAVTFPSGKYEIDGEIRFLYDDRNAHRMPAYHRMDVGATWKFKKRRNYDSSLNFSIYNVYGRKNAFTIDFEKDPNDPSKTRTVMTYLFSIIPSVTYNFRF